MKKIFSVLFVLFIFLFTVFVVWVFYGRHMIHKYDTVAINTPKKVLLAEWGEPDSVYTDNGRVLWLYHAHAGIADEFVFQIKDNKVAGKFDYD